MRNGELEAHFNTSQSVTRELLQESFSKLKDILSQHGIDSAYIGLGKENNRENDENLTETSSDQTEKAKSQEDMQNEVSVHKVENDTGRLDIKV
jgi:flagellar hook-length control protein FliK